MFTAHAGPGVPSDDARRGPGDAGGGGRGRRGGRDADLGDPSLYFNRELSWLDFNERVLELAEDPSEPLLERVKFCAIYANNLDEFFMVRVAGLLERVEARIDARGPDGMSPVEQVDEIQSRVLDLDDRLHACFQGTLRPALEEQGIRIISPRERQPRPSWRRSTPASTTRSSRR